MLFQVNGLQISNLQKAKEGATISVDIIANHLTEDTDNEIVLKQAFSKEAVNEFLSIGVVEFWHESRNPIFTKEEKNKNLIGKPTAFRWQNGKPVVTAELTKSHPIVQDMLPHLEANQPVYAGSIGGAKMILEVKDAFGDKKRVIPRIKWDHLAIAPTNSVINRAPGMNVKLLQKANDIICEFDDMNVFALNSTIIEKEEVLMKALQAPGSAADLYSTPGGVVTEQSLEEKPVNLSLSEGEGLDLIDTVIGIKERRIPTNKIEYMKYFKSIKKESFGDKSYRLIDKFFKSKKGAQ